MHSLGPHPVKRPDSSHPFLLPPPAAQVNRLHSGTLRSCGPGPCAGRGLPPPQVHAGPRLPALHGCVASGDCRAGDVTTVLKEVVLWVSCSRAAQDVSPSNETSLWAVEHAGSPSGGCWAFGKGAPGGGGSHGLSRSRPCPPLSELPGRPPAPPTVPPRPAAPSGAASPRVTSFASRPPC